MNWLCKLLRHRPLYRIEVFVDRGHDWRWRLRHVNGNILATSEAYSSRTAAWDTASALAAHTGFNIDEGVV